MSGPNLAIVGATGMVGRELIRVLEQRKFNYSSIRLYASDHSTGKKLYINHDALEVKETSQNSFDNVDIVLFSAGTETSKQYAPVAVRGGALVIDDSTAFRMEPDVPLVVPEINIEDAKKHKGIVSSPNCAVVPMVIALYPLHKVNPITRITVATYQSVSGTGQTAMEELSTQSKLILEGHTAVPHVYPHQIAFNLLPEIDVFLDNGYTKEEWKLVEETRKIMHAQNIAISATCVRVPLFIGHSEVINIEFANPISPADASEILTQAPGVRVIDDTAVSLYPQPWSVAGSDDVFIGRIRRDASHSNGLVMWVVADNIRRGAALNAVQIVEEMVKRGWR